MVSILQYQYEPESDPESGDKESQAEPPQTRLLQNVSEWYIFILFY